MLEGVMVLNGGLGLAGVLNGKLAVIGLSIGDTRDRESGRKQERSMLNRQL